MTIIRAQNDWPVLAPDSQQLRTWTEPDSGIRIRLRNGSAGFILIFLLSWFHARVERINDGQLDDWGYAFRPVRDGADWSNHAAGCAVDVNATQHPLGVPTARTFTQIQARRIRRKLRVSFLGTVRWGGDYRTRPDAMHFEIVRALPVCEQLARVLMRTRRGKRILAANPGQRKVILS